MGPQTRVAIFVFVLAASIWTPATSETLHLRKCCPADQMLDPQLESCVPKTPSPPPAHLPREERDDQWWWIPPNIVEEKINTRKKNDSTVMDLDEAASVSVELGAPQPCHVDFGAIYAWGVNVVPSPQLNADGSITVQQSGRHRLDKDSPGVKVRNYTFPPSSLCMDVVWAGPSEGETNTVTTATDVGIDISTQNNEIRLDRKTREATQSENFYDYLILVCPCVAGGVHCVHVCCPVGMVLQSSGRRTTCVPEPEGIQPSNTVAGRKFITEEEGSNLFTVYSIPRCENYDNRRYLLDQTKKSMENKSSHVFIQADGTALVDKFGYDAVLEADQFCTVTTIDRKTNHTRPNLLVCNNTTKRAHFAILAIFGAVFLGATILVYGCLPELRTRGLHSKNLIAHTGSLLLMYICLAMYYVAGNQLSQIPCSLLGFTMQFSFLASMFWLNVMCVDISWAFSGWTIPQGSAADRDRRVFNCYSVYAWGGAGLITLTTVAMDYVLTDDSYMIRPRMAEIECWFQETSGILLYYYGPAGVLLFINVILFVYTAGCILSVRRDTAVLRKAGGPTRTNGRGGARDRARFFLYVKLFSLMGVLWGTEVISWAVGGPKYYWYFTDAINLLRALFIFIMVCWKRKVGRLLACKAEGVLPSWCIPWEKGYFEDDRHGPCTHDPNGTRQVTTRTSSLQMGSSSTINQPPPLGRRRSSMSEVFPTNQSATSGSRRVSATTQQTIKE